MKFLNREDELDRLDGLARRRAGGLGVVHGRRRVGKTRMLVEWVKRHGGAYFVADQSVGPIQRRYLAEVLSARLPGFADVDYPDWRALFERVSTDCATRKWRGPIVLDEFPYLVLSSPELPSVLQGWIDHGAAAARLTVALAGSSQRMMQGLVLSTQAPLYGRARELLEIRPLAPGLLRQAFSGLGSMGLVEAFTCWGGIPRYWELAVEERGSQRTRVERLVLDPLGPLHREPDRLLLEEVPSAAEVRPLLEAIGSGVHRSSEIAGRMGRPATSLSRPLSRLLELGLARRELPFGVDQKTSRRALYDIEDQFFRMWFRVVAPNRARLASGGRPFRTAILNRHWPRLVAGAWEDLCRAGVPQLVSDSAIGELGPWGPAARWWSGNLPEWDVVAESMDGRRLLLGEAKWQERPLSTTAVERAARELARRPEPTLPARYSGHERVRVLFVPDLASRAPNRVDDVYVATCDEIAF